MSLDARIHPKAQPCFGCHSDLDKYRKDPAPPCEILNRHEERACEGCTRRCTSEQEASRLP